MTPSPWIPPSPLPPAAVTACNPSPSAPDRLRALLAGTGCLTLPCCFDVLSARLIEHQVDFATLRALVGFDAYDRLLDVYEERDDP